METNPRLQQRLRPIGIGCAIFGFIGGLMLEMGPPFTLTMAFLATYLMSEWVKHRRSIPVATASRRAAD